MVQVVNHGGRDAWVGASHPDANHGGAPWWRLSAGGQFGLLRMQFTVPRGATVTSATLKLHAKGSFPAQTLTARRFSDSFNERHVTWNNAPGTTGTNATVTTAALADGDPISLDVLDHVQSIAMGAKNYGWKVTTDDATDSSRIYGLDGGKFQPQLVIEYAEKPGIPTGIVPSDGSVCSDPAPTITYDYNDVTGEGMAAQRVMCDPAGNFTTPAFDSGWVDATEPEFDLSASTFTAMTEDATMQGQIQVRGNDGGESDPSDVFEWTYKAQVNVTLGSPSAATPNVFEPTPPVTATLDKPAAAYEVRITRQDDHTHVLYNSHKVPANGATTLSHTIPKKWRGNRVLRDDIGYALNWRVWDQETARQATPGHPIFGFAWVDFTADTDAAVAPVDSLTVEQDGITPWVILTWTRSSAPDSWVIRMDGHVVESDILPADVLVSGSTYQWRFKGASPRKAHTFHVRAVVNGRSSPNGPAATITTQPVGMWIIDPDTYKAAVIFGDDPGSMSQPDLASLYTTLSGLPRRVVTGKQGLQGQMTGVLVDALGQDPATNEATLWSFAETPDKEFQIILADVSIPGWFGDLNIFPTPDTNGDQIVKGVSFSFGQTGDFPFDLRL